MLSHFQRFHRRGPSNPTSPVPPESPIWDNPPSHLAQSLPQDGQIPAPDHEARATLGVPHFPGHEHPQPPSQPPPPPPMHSPPPVPPSAAGSVSPQGAPMLPPIARVTSTGSELAVDAASLSINARPREDNRPSSAQPGRSPYSEQSSTGFIGGVALRERNYRMEQEAAGMRPPSSDRSELSPYSQNMMSPPSRPTSKATSRAGSSFIAPTDIQGNMGATGKRPASAKPPGEPQVLPAQMLSPEPAKAKKGLPFLKNPMSTLLMRRKTAQNAPELSLDLDMRNAIAAYEPIRGTRVHDFSAPRPRKVVSSTDIPTTQPMRPPPVAGPPITTVSLSPGSPAPPVPPKDGSASLPPEFSTPATAEVPSMTAASSTTPPPALPHYDHGRNVSVASTASQNPSRASISFSVASSTRTRTPGQRNSSVPSRNVSVLSHIPKHMRSTSSRFSFDMIGAAKAEKYLEELHRQKQADKKPESVGQRDSRFDDFEDDGFDYDAMDFDDGLEERIPGVNADYEDYEEDIPYTNDDFTIEEEEEPEDKDEDEVEDEAEHEAKDELVQVPEEEQDLNDPDNDQENFSGFVFQRSASISELASPHSAGVLPTPRDADGNIIGFATGNATPSGALDFPHGFEDEDTTLRPIDQPLHDMPNVPTGLGIHGLDPALDDISDAASSVYDDEENEAAVSAPSKALGPDDELYFGGMGHEFEGEGDGSAIDESLFDLDDTDKYGRPIPGMFANAVARSMANQAVEKRQSDEITSRFSAQSAQSQSTAHTSVSVGMHHKAKASEYQTAEDLAPWKGSDSSLSASQMSPQDKMAAYGDALTAAAHKAAASGKFRRDSSPAAVADLKALSPTLSESDQGKEIYDSIEDYEQDDQYAGSGLDDYELDDDAIVAEANAEALASDSDGWYGQEFGFYAAPGSQGGHGPNALSQQNVYQYSNGGFFGPGGVHRSKSGHIVSREPNLTPITERSEYSNRNSIMSLALPPPTGREPPLHSPGLAQLAMMADDNDNMTLSALMKLRSKAWGGSQASLASSREGSPSERNGASSPWGQESKELLGVNQPSQHARKNSTFSLWSQDSSGQGASGSGSGSPTLTMSIGGNVPNHAIPPLSALSGSSNTNSAASPHGAASLFSPLSASTTAFPPLLEDDEVDTGDYSVRSPVISDPAITRKPLPASASSDIGRTAGQHDSMVPTVGIPSQKRPGMGHRHQGSAESISYVKEEVGGGSEGRWVMERRRTAESGEIEVLGRQVVEGGRI